MTQPDVYEALPYESVAFPETHPARLGGMAHFYGLATVLPECARVLELGCASGGNLIPMAASLPGARFTGIDFSPRQIATGNQWLDDLAIENCELICADISNSQPDGEFDYIIAHGVYSWVAAPVREALLRLCRDRLAPNGVVYISFNTLPGWRQKQVLRDFLVFHQQTLGGNTPDFAALREAFAAVAETPHPPGALYGHILSDSLAKMASHSDAYLAHEYMEPVNEACYLTDFVAHAGQFELAYLGEAKPRITAQLTLDALKLPAELDSVQREQYLDFLEGTQFRRALLHRKGCGRHSASPTAALSYTSVSALKITTQSDGNTLVSFDGGKSVHQPGPACDLLMAMADAWPEAMPGSELASSADLGTELARLVRAGIVVPWLGEGSAARREISLTPEASALARYQAGQDLPVTSFHHGNVQLDDFQRHLFQKLDGKHDQTALQQGVQALLDTGTIRIEGAQDADGLAGRVLDQQLQVLMELALLR